MITTFLLVCIIAGYSLFLIIRAIIRFVKAKKLGIPFGCTSCRSYNECSNPGKYSDSCKK